MKMTTLCLLFALTVAFDLEMCQMDVRAAFLHGELDEERHIIKHPKGFVILGKEKLVYNLNELKQAPRQCYKKFGPFMLTRGFKHSHAN